MSKLQTKLLVETPEYNRETYGFQGLVIFLEVDVDETEPSIGDNVSADIFWLGTHYCGCSHYGETEASPLVRIEQNHEEEHLVWLEECNYIDIDIMRLAFPLALKIAPWALSLIVQTAEKMLKVESYGLGGYISESDDWDDIAVSILPDEYNVEHYMYEHGSIPEYPNTKKYLVENWTPSDN